MNDNRIVDKITLFSVILILLSIFGAFYFSDGISETTLSDIKKVRELKD
ncbi:hypothetical protein [Candidatus Sulfurimonas baltica]|uniref:Uncharacterized protein n=1 Tax=Candidatus Sulfurimonas baltica TaxID=2740404 RepID=A0A7S7RN41_9BACT|nr:hypothetical protein [Candidatus Sulfurimonas baltica]QOY52035.1 hypothetical protein HUE88_13270 [Candidatus Sulfurimonas baltica]